MRILIIILIFAVPVLAGAKEKSKHYSERVYQNHFCKGETEVRTPMGRRADCVDGNMVWEVDFARKWKECVDQATIYALELQKKPGCLLIVEKESQEKYWKYLNQYIEMMRLPIVTMKITAEEIEEEQNQPSAP